MYGHKNGGKQFRVVAGEKLNEQIADEAKKL
jgi:hypothetical protein